jgi:mxaK protein
LLVVLAGIVYHGSQLYRIDRLQRDLADPTRIRVDADTPEVSRFAKALHLARQGEVAEAIRLYNGLRDSDDLGLRERALHNLATLYLRDAASLWNSRGVLEYSRVLTLVELAKEHYREVLRLNPANWDARHNLEYTHRITPPPREKPKADFQGTKSSVFATLPGLPGGGP